MLFTQAALAMVSVALAVLAHAQRTTPAAIYALAFVAGAATAFDNPARQALVPRLVDRGQLPNALSSTPRSGRWPHRRTGARRRAARLERTDRDLPSRRAFFWRVIAALLAMRHRHVGGQIADSARRPRWTACASSAALRSSAVHHAARLRGDVLRGF